MLQKRFKFTDLSLRTLPFTEQPSYVWDSYTRGLGLRIGKFTKTFLIINADRKRMTLGKFPHTSLLDARKRHAAIKYGTAIDLAASDAPRASQALEKFLQAHAAKTRLSTQRQTQRILTRRFLPALGDRTLDGITTADLTAIIEPIAKRSPAEANATYAKLNGFFNWCVRSQMIARNPLSTVQKPAPVAQRDRVLSDSELAAVLKTALQIFSTPYGAITLIIAFTGLRRNEAHTLRWSLIDNHTITIPKEIAKNNVELILPNNIRGYLASIPKTDDRLFPDNIRWHAALTALHQRSNTGAWKLHDLRRTLSTNMAKWEIAPPDVVEAILNHTTGGSRSQIQRVYDRHSRLPQMHRALGAYADRLHALMKSQ
jgi:integrase